MMKTNIASKTEALELAAGTQLPCYVVETAIRSQVDVEPLQIGVGIESNRIYAIRAVLRDQLCMSYVERQQGHDAKGPQPGCGFRGPCDVHVLVP